MPGLVVTPSEGLVPGGGKTALQVHFNPESPIKFDTRIEASVETEEERSFSPWIQADSVFAHLF